MSGRRLALCVHLAAIAVPMVVGAVSCDGTNTWIGAASGGSWKNPANWRASSAAGYTVEQLFQRYAVYDLRGLAAGAVLTNDYSGGNVYNLRNSTGQTFVYGLVASGSPGDVWTVVPGFLRRRRPLLRARDDRRRGWLLRVLDVQHGLEEERLEDLQPTGRGTPVSLPPRVVEFAGLDYRLADGPEQPVPVVEFADVVVDPGEDSLVELVPETADGIGT